MASEAVMEFNDQTFDAEVLKSDVPVLVDFWAEWCMPCRMLAPTIEDLATQFKGKAKVGKLDVDSNREVTLKYNINAVPTVILFKDGQPAKRIVGMTSKNDLAKAINELAAV